MKSMFDKLNLRPGERRLVVIVGIVVFVVLNIWFVWPNIGAYAKAQKDISAAKSTLQRFRMEAGRKAAYERDLHDLETKGAFIGQEDQALQLSREIASQAALSGVTVLRYDPGQRMQTGRTNAFFDEAALLINVSTGEKELVDFLYNLASKNSLIRVRSMNLGTEPQRYKLQGSLTLVESFQKKAPPPPPKPAAAAPPAKAPAQPKPAATQPKSAAPPPKTTAKPADTAKPATSPAKSPSNTKTNQTRQPGASGK